MEPFPALAAALNQAGVRYVTIGVSGANFWARSGHTIFSTRDHDLLLPLDAENALRAWGVADARGLDLLVGDEPLDRPRDRLRADRIVELRALVRATDGRGFDVDFTLVMAGFDSSQSMVGAARFWWTTFRSPSRASATSRPPRRLLVAKRTASSWPRAEALRSLIDEEEKR